MKQLHYSLRALCTGLLLTSLLTLPQVTEAQVKREIRNTFLPRHLYEPECETVGAELSIVEAASASSGQYLAAGDAVYPETAPDGPEGYVRMSFASYAGSTIPEDFTPYFRLRQAGSDTVAIWLRTNAGPWKLFTYTTAYASVGTEGWKWVPDTDNMPADNRLGLNGDTLRTLDIAFTHADQQLDEVYLESATRFFSKEDLRPFDRMYVGTNCPDFHNTPPVAKLANGTESIVGPGDCPTVSAEPSYDPNGDGLLYIFRTDNGEITFPEDGSGYTRPDGQWDCSDAHRGSSILSVTVYDFYGAADTDSTLYRIRREDLESYGPYYRIQAACAQIGSNWSPQPDTTSPEKVVAPSVPFLDEPPADIPENKLRFVLPGIPESILDDPDPSYYILGVFDLPEEEGNCVWVNVNGAGWRKWEVIDPTSIYGSINLNTTENVIELAYCSPDLEVRYLNFSSDLGSTSPYYIYRGLDKDANVTDITCAPPSLVSEFWLEAECAQVGAKWQRPMDNDASNQYYLVVTEENSLALPPSDAPENYVRFTTEDAQAGKYQLQARIRAPTNLDDSYYVRVNKGPWYAWKNGIIKGEKFAWNLLPGGGIDLSEGTNTIDFAYRENGTELDKIYLGESVSPPIGGGDEDAGCEVTGSSPREIEISAECAIYGNAWVIGGDEEAGLGAYLVAQERSLNTPPPDVPENLVTFTFFNSSRQIFPLYLYARVKAATSHNDSYWVRLNGGEWVAWTSIRDGTGTFEWNRFPRVLDELEDGYNVLDFAYRESGAKLDGIFLSSIDRLPTQPPVTIAGECTTLKVVEAECSTGDGWREFTSDAADGGAYVNYVGPRHLNEPADDYGTDQLTYVYDVNSAGDYYLFLRLNAPDNSRNSVWISVDEGEWVRMWQEIGGAQLHTEGFEWRKLNDNGVEVTFSLDIGRHTVRIANREPGTEVDRLFLSTDPSARRFIPDAVSCSRTQQPAALPQFEPVAKVRPATDFHLGLYPNPVSHELTFDLTSDYTGTVNVLIYDAAGRRLRQLKYDKEEGLLRTRLQVADLSPGLYRLQLIEGDRQTTKSFVRM